MVFERRNRGNESIGLLDSWVDRFWWMDNGPLSYALRKIARLWYIINWPRKVTYGFRIGGGDKSISLWSIDRARSWKHGLNLRGIILRRVSYWADGGMWVVIIGFSLFVTPINWEILRNPVTTFVFFNSILYIYIYILQTRRIIGGKISYLVGIS